MMCHETRWEDPSLSRCSTGSPAIRAVALSALLAIAFVGCAALPTEFERPVSAAYTDTQDTALGREAALLSAGRSDESGFYPLIQGLDALVARIVLADEAERSLDVQYYLWKNDATGRLLLERLLRAADRGVRVRLLLDDVLSGETEPVLTMLDLHPNFEVRVFNPFAIRGARGLGFVTDFRRVNRRMHNKSFTGDNQVTIVGGRNMGDEYFDARPDVNFGDLDVLAVGPVVNKVSNAFDEYWNNEWAFPSSAFERTRPSTLDDLEKLRIELREATAELADSPYAAALRDTRLAQELKSGQLPLVWGKAQLIYDSPEKIAAQTIDESTSLGIRLEKIVEQTTDELVLVSAYFVPGKEGVEFFSQLVRRGVRVRILTNSLATNNHAVVHSGYARYRIPLLRAGVELYEFRPRAIGRDDSAESSAWGATLHAKTFGFDRRYLFVGSFNLDPRSDALNTEMGVLFESPELAGRLARWFDEEIALDAYRLALKTIPPEESEIGFMEYALEWVTVDEQGNELRYSVEPETSFWRRFGASLMSLLPIESQL